MPGAPFPRIEAVLTIGTWDVIEAFYADTGFSGAVAVPEGAGREILMDPGVTLVRLGGGQLQEVLSWPVLIAIGDRVFEVEGVAIGAEYLLGRRILDQMEVCFEFGRTLRYRFAED